jgi:hypothetical protein
VDIRSEVIEILATPGSEDRFYDPYLPAAIRQRTGCRPHQVWEALWGLVSDGLVYLDPEGQPPTDNWRWKLSERGMQAAAGGPWEPRDLERYLRTLRRRVSELDPVALRYVEGALRAFNARCFLASSVMLGVALEQVFTSLARSVVKAQGKAAARLQRTLDDPRISQRQRFNELRKLLEPLRPQLPDDLGDNLTIDAVADLLRITRNDAGHPTGRDVDEDTAHVNLQMAGRYMGKMTDLRQHFDAQKPAE